MVDRLIKPPEELPVSMNDARTAARIDGADLDCEIAIRVRTITDEVEHLTGRAIIKQTWRVTLDSFPVSVRLPKPPVVRVVAVKYLDLEGQLRTLDPSGYQLDAINEPGYLLPARGTAWPATLKEVNAVSIDVVCGYGPDESTTPAGIKGYILARLQELYASSGASESPHLVRMLDRYRI